MNKTFRMVIAGALATAMAAAPAAAFASHFRSSYTNATFTGDTLDWTLDSAWRSDDSDDFGSASLYSVDAPGADPGQGSYISDATMSDPIYDYSSPLYVRTTETATYDLSSLGDGQYDAFTEDCCRVGGVMNTSDEDSFSQWYRFSKSSGVYNLAPDFNSPTLYLIIPLSGLTTVDFTATDPEGSSVTYDAITNTGYPYYGSTGLPCSTFSAGTLTLGSSLCTGGDVFTDIYTPGSFWTFKVQATDTDGNFSTVDTLFRVITPPEPEIDDAYPNENRPGNAYDFEVYANDTIADSFTVTCTNIDDPTNVLSGTAPARPVLVEGLQPGASYECDVSAVNSAGTGNNDQNYFIGPIEMDGLDLTLELDAGMQLSGAQSILAGGNLQPNSTYTLERRSVPVVIYTNVADAQGNFYEYVTIPQEACAYGVHELVLTGVNTLGETMSDTVWVEMDNNCVAVQISRTEITPSLPSLPNTGLSTLSIVLGMMLAGVMFVFASGTFTAKGQLQFVARRDRLVYLLSVADFRLRRAERQSRRR